MTTKSPIHRLTKKEIVWLATHYCPKHRHTYLEHYSCYEPKEPRLGFFDIESSNLDADFGIILSWSIKDSLTNDILSDVLTLEDITSAKPGQEDKRLVQSLVEALGLFDTIVTYYGKRFDAPYLRARALVTNVKFPNYGTLAHIDLYDTIKAKFKLSSRRLENACRVLLGKTNKTRIDAKYWRGGVRGDKKSLDYILNHNKRDVVDLEKLYYKTINFVRKQDTSI